MKWFKFYGQDWLTDMKVMSMSMEDRLCFLTLLCLGSQTNGVIKGCTEESLIKLANIPNDPTSEYNPTEKAEGCLARFEALEMITNDNKNKLHIVTLCNFAARQGTNLTNYERVKRHRQKKQALRDIENDNNVDVINDNKDDVIKDNTRLDKIRLYNIGNKVADGIHPKKEEKQPFSFEVKFQSMIDNPRIDIKIIALYWKYKNFKFDNDEQYTSALKRELIAAKALKGYTSKQISDTMDFCNSKFEMWTLETVSKRINDVIKQ